MLVFFHRLPEPGIRLISDVRGDLALRHIGVGEQPLCHIDPRRRQLVAEAAPHMLDDEPLGLPLGEVQSLRKIRESDLPAVIVLEELVNKKAVIGYNNYFELYKSGLKTYKAF